MCGVRGVLGGRAERVSVGVFMVICVHCPAVYLLAHLHVCANSSFFSSHSSSCPAPRGPSKSLRYFHSGVSVLIFTLISWLDTGAPPGRPAYASHNSLAVFTTSRANTWCVEIEFQLRRCHHLYNTLVQVLHNLSNVLIIHFHFHFDVLIQAVRPRARTCTPDGNAAIINVISYTS